MITFVVLSIVTALLMCAFFDVVEVKIDEKGETEILVNKKELAVIVGTVFAFFLFLYLY